MLKIKLLHPDILKALASSGHSSRVLIADGNFPVASRSNPAAARVFLNLMPGVVKTTEVLEALLSAIPIEEATIMEIPGGVEAPVIAEYRSMLPSDIEIKRMERFAFYDAVSSSNTTLVIATGDTRRFANLLLTIGVVKLEQTEQY